MDRISYIYEVKVTGPTNPIHKSIPSAAPLAAVFALRQMQICASTNAMSRFRTNVMMYGKTGFMLAAFSAVICSSAIHGLANKTAYHNAPSIQYARAETNTAA